MVVAIRFPIITLVAHCRRIVSAVAQDTYWCHAVSVFTAFSPNRVGEYDSHYRIYCRITIVPTVVLTGVAYTSEVAQ